MTRSFAPDVRAVLVFAAAAAASVGAIAQDRAPPPAAPNNPLPPEARALIESCSAHKFETTVEAMVDGKSRRSKVKLCGQAGQTDADWARTLADAVSKVAVNADMPAEVRAQITTALTAEIARIAAAAAAPRAVFDAPVGPPPMPLPQYSVLPPLPSVSPAPPAPPAPPIKPVQAVPARPRLTFTCSNPRDIGQPTRCTDLEPGTRLTVRADEPLEAGVRLRFLRRGEARGDITLAAMRAGQSARYRLPEALCSGILNARVDFEIIRGGGAAARPVATEGPFSLHC